MGSRRTTRAAGIAAMALLGFLAACRAEPPSREDGATRQTRAHPSTPVIRSPEHINDTAPQPDEMKGAAGARHVLGLWADALERSDWQAARAQWGDDGAMSGLSPADYAARYARYRQLKVKIDRGEADAGAGSLFYAAPITLSGITREGAPFLVKGRAYLRRVNDVPGASAAQLRWHIERIDIADAADATDR